MKRTKTASRLSVLALSTVVALALAGCGTSDGGGSDTAGGGSSAEGGAGFTPPDVAMAEELGDNEGEVDILAWPGYAEDGSNDPKVDWVTPFEKETGCQAKVKYFATSDEAVSLMKTGEYDVVSASGDASLRLIASGDVAPVNTDLIPNYADLYDYLKEIQAFTTGDSVVGTTWQVIANVAQSEDVPVEVLLPDEGSTGWSDTWMVAADAAHPNCAYAWMNHIISPEANAAVAEYFGEAPSNPKACDIASKGHCESFHAGDEEYAANIWYWTTPIPQCIDGRTDVTCTDYGDWTQAWTEVKG